LHWAQALTNQLPDMNATLLMSMRLTGKNLQILNRAFAAVLSSSSFAESAPSAVEIPLDDDTNAAGFSSFFVLSVPAQ